MNNKYFFCYSLPLQHFLHEECGFSYVVGALHERTKKQFWLYERNENINTAIDQYYNLVKTFKTNN